MGLTILQNACHSKRLGCQRWHTTECLGAREKCNKIVLSMCTAQCGSMEAKALSFVLRAAGREHHQSSTRRVFTYVVGGRVGMNDACYFTLDMKKLDSIPTPSLLHPDPSTLSLFLINIHPLLSPPPTPEKSLCIPYNLPLGFILTLNLYVTDDRPRPTPCVFQ